MFDQMARHQQHGLETNEQEIKALEKESPTAGSAGTRAATTAQQG